MNHIATFLSGLLHRRANGDARLEADLDAELSFHIERTVEELVDSGVEQSKARSQALARFGSIDVVKHQCRSIAMGKTIVRRRLALVAAALVLVAAGFNAWWSSNLWADEWARISPFSALRWADDRPMSRPMVQVDGRWYELLAINGMKASEIIAFCQRRYGDRAEKRFVEDIYDVLLAAGIADPKVVDLRVRDEMGQEQVLHGIPMTREKRQAIMIPRLRQQPGPWKRLSPFPALRWHDSEPLTRPIIEIEGRSYELLAIAGHPVADVIAYCKRRFGEHAEKRFVEDLYEVLAGMGVQDLSAVDLQVRAEDGAIITFEQVPMTAENRQALMGRRH